MWMPLSAAMHSLHLSSTGHLCAWTKPREAKHSAVICGVEPVLALQAAQPKLLWEGTPPQWSLLLCHLFHKWLLKCSAFCVQTFDRGHFLCFLLLVDFLLLYFIR